MNEQGKIGTLTIKRFTGDEIWNITEGELSVSPREDYYLLNFWVASLGDLIAMPSSENSEEEE